MPIKTLSRIAGKKESDHWKAYTIFIRDRLNRSSLDEQFLDVDGTRLTTKHVRVIHADLTNSRDCLFQ